MDLNKEQQLHLLRNPDDRVSDLTPVRRKLTWVLDQEAGANFLPQAGPWMTSDGPHHRINSYIPTPFNPLGAIGKGGHTKRAPIMDEGETGNVKEAIGNEGAQITT